MPHPPKHLAGFTDGGAPARGLRLAVREGPVGTLGTSNHTTRHEIRTTTATRAPARLTALREVTEETGGDPEPGPYRPGRRAAPRR
ncbi:hypothetical protein [Streptomyces cremeus]|uniref:Uncharacterized protein n=1 Tax=Streptomyces cremeus TaxID=66881 RepID=A0ABV5PDQ5_STRCM